MGLNLALKGLKLKSSARNLTSDVAEYLHYDYHFVKNTQVSHPYNRIIKLQKSIFLSSYFHIREGIMKFSKLNVASISRP
jgi:pentose-5-phosphate-3-epimerase